MKRVTHRELLGCSWRSLIKTVNDRSSVTPKLFFSFFPGEGRLKVNRWPRPLRPFRRIAADRSSFGMRKKKGNKNFAVGKWEFCFLCAVCRRINHAERVGAR